MRESSGDVIRLMRETDKRSRKEDEGTDGLYSHWMFVVHDREELIDRKQFAHRVGLQELLGSL